MADDEQGTVPDGGEQGYDDEAAQRQRRLGALRALAEEAQQPGEGVGPQAETPAAVGIATRPSPLGLPHWQSRRLLTVGLAALVVCVVATDAFVWLRPGGKVRTSVQPDILNLKFDGSGIVSQQDALVTR